MNVVLKPAENTSTQSDSENEPVADSTQSETDRKKRIKQTTLNHLLNLIATLICLAVFLGFCDRHFHALDIFAQFRFQLALILIALSVGMALRKSWYWAMGCLLLSIPTLFVVGLLYLPNQTTYSSKDSSEYRLLLLNVLEHNHKHEEVSQLVEDADPDLICFVEFTRSWEKRLPSIRSQYPYTAFDPRFNGNGVRVFSKYPISFETDQSKAHRIGLAPVGVARVTLPDAKITLVGIHTKSPTTVRRVGYRNSQIKALSAIIKSQHGPLICCGDFNSTTFAHGLYDFVRETKLNDSRRGFGIQPSWPSPKKLIPLRVTIDHIFVSDHIKIHDRFIGPNVGSDHLPVIMDFSVENN